MLWGLRDKGLYARFLKCDFWLGYLVFLGYVVSKEDIMVNLIKVKVVLDWSRPTSPIKIWSFISFSCYYRQFLEGLSTITAPLARLTQNNIALQWFDECKASFQKIKALLTSTLSQPYM